MKLIAILVLATLVGCATSKHQGNIAPFSTKAYNTWFLETDPVTKKTWPIFCMANVKAETAAPKCYRAE